MRIKDIISFKKTEYTNNYIKGIIKDENYDLILDFYDEIFLIYLDEFVNNM